jgi:diguanylate cyclase (GGDEF)-like protein
MPNINKLFDKAEKLLQKDQLDAAREVFLEIFQYQPEDETVLLKLGELSAKLHRPPDALRYWGLLLDRYIAGGDVSKAVVIGRKILKVAPRDTATLAKLAPVFEKARKSAEALDAYRELMRAYRDAGESDHALACLRHIVQLDPEDMEAHVELGELAGKAGQPVPASRSLFQAAELARKKGLEDRWADLAVRAHNLDPTNDAARLAAAEVSLAQDRAGDVAALLEPLARSKPEDLTVLDYLSQAYLRTADYAKAQPVCAKLYQSRPEAIGMVEQLIKGLLSKGETPNALTLIEAIKDQLYRQGKKRDFLAVMERVHQADESNLKILEMLAALYNELNRDEGVRWSLARLFHLYLATEQYNPAAETLEKIIDVEPYGAGHQDRLLNLEGHLDPIWYKNIERRLQVPGTAPDLSARTAQEEAGAPAEEKVEALDEMIVEAEMYQRYKLSTKLANTLKKINRLYPGAEESDERLRDLYVTAGFHPTPPPAPASVDLQEGQEPRAMQGSGFPQPLEELGKLSRITGSIYREGTPERVMVVAVNQIGQALGADRCWGAMESSGSPPALTAEYQGPGIPPSPPAAAAKVYAFFMRRENTPSEEWSFRDVGGSPTLKPIARDLQELGIASLLGAPLTEKEERVGVLLVEQCRTNREWTPGEKMLLETLAPQVVIAVNHVKLRRLVRSLAGTDPATGLLPRTAYLDCLLAEASRAKDQSRPLTLCLIEPVGAPNLAKNFGEAKFQDYLQQVSKLLSSHLRQNDIAVRYGPCTIAICFPDTAAAQAQHAVEKLQDILRTIPFDAESPRVFCAAICDVPLRPGFDAVDGVTEAINRLESSMDRVREQGGTQILLSCFEG